MPKKAGGRGAAAEADLSLDEVLTYIARDEYFTRNFQLDKPVNLVGEGAFAFVLAGVHNLTRTPIVIKVVSFSRPRNSPPSSLFRDLLLLLFLFYASFKSANLFANLRLAEATY